MKLIGHAACALIAATPLILVREHLPFGLNPEMLSDQKLLWWVGVWSAAPDLDLLLARWTPLKHRGFASHSLFTALMAGLLVLAAIPLLPILAESGGDAALLAQAAAPFAGAFTALLAALAVFVHILGDSLTKTGVPLLRPNAYWHFPMIGGYAVYDSLWLNLPPVVVALALLHLCFGLDFDTKELHRLLRWQ